MDRLIWSYLKQEAVKRNWKRAGPLSLGEEEEDVVVIPFHREEGERAAKALLYSSACMCSPPAPYTEAAPGLREGDARTHTHKEI